MTDVTSSHYGLSKLEGRWELHLGKLGESHPRVVVGIKKNAMIVRENFGDFGNLVTTVGNSLI
jgi:hypothetical protein